MSVRVNLSPEYITVYDVGTGKCLWVPVGFRVAGRKSGCAEWAVGLVEGIVGSRDVFERTWSTGCDISGVVAGVATDSKDSVRSVQVVPGGGQLRGCFGGSTTRGSDVGVIEPRKVAYHERVFERQDGVSSSADGDVGNVGAGRSGTRVAGEAKGGRDEDTGSLGSGSCLEQTGSQGIKNVPVSMARGKHNEKNRRRRERQREKRSCASGITTSVVGAVSSVVSGGDSFTGTGYFSGCSVEVQRRLRETRAEKLIAQNMLDAVEARDKLDRVEKDNATRVSSTRYEVDRLILEEKLAKLSERRLGTSVSSDSTKGSSGGSGLRQNSVSPNSSISVAEEMALRKEVSESKKLLDKRNGELDYVRRELESMKKIRDIGGDWGRCRDDSELGDDFDRALDLCHDYV